MLHNLCNPQLTCFQSNLKCGFPEMCLAIFTYALYLSFFQQLCYRTLACHTCGIDARSRCLLMLWVWSLSGPGSWCVRKTAKGACVHRASSCARQRKTDSSPHGHIWADAGACLLGTWSPEPAEHPPPGPGRLRQEEQRCEPQKELTKCISEMSLAYSLNRWPPLPLLHLLWDNAYGCYGDTAE